MFAESQGSLIIVKTDLSSGGEAGGGVSGSAGRPLFAGFREGRFAARFLPERVALLYQFDGRDVLPLVLIAGIAGFTLWGLIHPPLLGSLLAWFVLMRIARAGISVIYRRANPPAEAAARWEDFYCIMAVLFGAAWGLVSLHFYASRDLFQELTVTFLISLVAFGLPASLAASPKTFVGFMVPLVTPLVGLLLARGGAVNISVAMMLLLYSAMVLWLYLSANSALLDKLELDAKNDELTNEVKVAKERLSLAMRSSQVTIWEWSAVRGNIYVDEARSTMRGSASGERYLQIEEALDLTHPDDRQMIVNLVRGCLKGEAPGFHVEARVRKLDGDWMWVFGRGQVVERDAGGQALRMIGTNIDISQRKLAEDELMASLQREKELSEMKSKFVSMASHEFRTPLATILSSSELIEHYSETLSAEDRAGVIGGMKDAVKRMSALLDDVLTIGKAEAGVLKYHGESVHLRSFCERLAATFGQNAGKQHTLQFKHNLTDDEPVETDESLLHHIMDNLRTNAAKYSPPGKPILFGVQRQGTELLITVADQGIGIPEKDQPRLFEGFFRASNVEKRLGTGLGLAIVKKAVESHGGTISFVSEQGKGTRFEVRLPLRGASGQTDASH